MPDLDAIPVPLYEANQPYHWEFDNLPLQALKERDELINREVDVHGRILRESNGTQGTLANRLNQSIDEDGNLKVAAVDETMHNIGKHTDGTVTVDTDELEYYVDTLGYEDVSNPVPFVRMLAAERAKLADIAPEATNMTLQFEATPSNIVLFEQGPVYFAPSPTIEWAVVAPNIVRANLRISTEFAHRHYYDIEPIMIPTDDIEPVSNKLYQISNSNTEYVEGSLRVYINGVRLSSEVDVYYPNSTATEWTLNSFTPTQDDDSKWTLFTLSVPITDEDVIRIDFDQELDAE